LTAVVEVDVAVDVETIVDLDLDLLEEARETGDVRNWNDRHASDWPMGRSL